VRVLSKNPEEITNRELAFKVDGNSFKE